VTKCLGAVVITGYLLTLLTSHHTLNTLKVGGPLYDQIVTGKDLVADILPPPAYLIEAYLEATLALAAQRDAAIRPEARSKIAVHGDRLKTLEADYRTRHAFWQGQELDAELKAAFLTASYEPGKRFWNIVNESLLPALSRDDASEARRLYADLSQAYQEHRAAIDRTVELANKESEHVLAEAGRQETINLALMWGVGLAVLVLVAAGAGGVLFAILGPVNRINQAMSTLSAGRNDIHIPHTTRSDEIGEMARAVDVFRANAIERERLESRMTQTRQKEIERQQGLDRHLLAFKDTITTNVEILLKEVGDLRQTSDTLLQKASEASREASASAAASTTAAAGSQAVAAATEELNASIREISTQAHSTSSIVGQTTERAKSTDAEVANLTDAVGKIETVVTLIRQIAQQTNLLALNATIESARAGEAGKGFAVVAAEVKGLSDQTAKATEEIAQQIHTVQATTESAATAVRAIGAQVGEIHHLATSVAAAVEQQQAATADIARNVNVVATGTTAAAESSRFVTEIAEHTGAEARRLAAASNQLQQVSTAVSDAVQRFIEAVSSDLSERRSATRQAAWGVVVVTRAGNRKQAKAVDISTTGMKVAVDGGIATGDTIELHIGAHRMKANVVWSGQDNCGLRFVEPISQEQLERLGLLASSPGHLAA
jgi:methyl-accepting chemotaxis protein